MPGAIEVLSSAQRRYQGILLYFTNVGRKIGSSHFLYVVTSLLSFDQLFL